jgi:hypothetical protein
MAIFRRSQEEHDDIDPMDTIKGNEAWETIFDSKKSGIEDIKGIKLEKSSNRKKILIIAASIVTIMALGFGGYCLYDYMMSLRNNQIVNNEQPSTSSSQSVNQNGLKNPAADANDINGSLSGPVQITVEDNRNVALNLPDKKKHTLVFPALTDNITVSSDDCTLKNQAANCYLGTSKVNDQNISIYAIRDAKSSSLLYASTDYKVTPSNGAGLAYVRKMTVSDKKDVTALIIVFKDQTGVILTSDNADAITSLAAGDTHFNAMASE